MTPELVLTVGNRALEVATVLMLIMLVPALIVGLVISIFQAATQINEQTLSFIPKLLVTMLVLSIAGSMMLRMLTDFTTQLFGSIPSIIG